MPWHEDTRTAGGSPAVSNAGATRKRVPRAARLTTSVPADYSITVGGSSRGDGVIQPTQASRIGIIVPSSNTVAEVDFNRNIPDGVSVHTARMYLVETTAAGERAMLETYLPQAIEDIASARPHVVAFACTSAAALIGYEGEQRLIEGTSRACGCPVVSTNDAVGRCIERASPRRVAIITPYVDELNEKIRAGVERRGITVSSIDGMGLTENFTIAQVTPSEIVAFAAERLRGVEFDLLFVSCTNFRGLAARDALSERFGVPVVTSNQASLQITLETLDAALSAATA
jgi:maleate isomerase